MAWSPPARAPKPIDPAAQATLDRGRARGEAFARLDCEAGLLDDRSLEIVTELARAARPLSHADLERVLAYARALAAW